MTGLALDAWSLLLGQFGQLISLVFGGQRAEQFVHVAVHDRGDLVQRQVDPVVGDPSLWEIVGADTLGAVAGTDQALAGTGDDALLGAHLDVLDPGSQHAHGRGLVGVLRTTVLAFGNDAGRQVGDAHRRVGLVDVLAASTGGTEGVDAQVGRVEVDVLDLVGFRHHGNGARRGVDAPLGFGLRHALHAVAAGVELQARISAVAGQPADDFAVAAELGL